jgi:hypothetical protein
VSPAKEKLIEKRVEVLLEVGSEEIPAGMLPKAEEDLRANLEKLLTAENLSDGVTVETFSAPRRLVAYIRGVREKQADVVNEVTGPPKTVAYDAVGEPTRAAHSFAEKQGLSLKDLYTVKTPKGEYLAAKQTRRGRTAEQILSEILPRAIHDLSWPRSMTWTGIDGARFIRPIRWIVAVVNRKPLKFSFAGVTAGDTTLGHRFLGKGPLRVKDFADYEKKLKANGVIVRPTERREKISKELAAHAKRSGYRIHEDAELLKLVTYLNECPSVLEGDFDPAYLALPDEILPWRGEAGKSRRIFLRSSICRKILRAWYARGTSACCARVLLTRNFSGSRTRNVGSPTICQSLNGSPTNQGWEVTATKWSGCGRLHGGLPSSGSTEEYCKRMWQKLIGRRNSRSATWPQRWFASLQSCRGSSADFTRVRRENRIASPMRFTITTGQWD